MPKACHLPNAPPPSRMHARTDASVNGASVGVVFSGLFVRWSGCSCHHNIYYNLHINISDSYDESQIQDG